VTGQDGAHESVGSGTPLTGLRVVEVSLGLSLVGASRATTPTWSAEPSPSAASGGRHGSRPATGRGGWRTWSATASGWNRCCARARRWETPRCVPSGWRSTATIPPTGRSRWSARSSASGQRAGRRVDVPHRPQLPRRCGSTTLRPASGPDMGTPPSRPVAIDRSAPHDITERSLRCDQTPEVTGPGGDPGRSPKAHSLSTRAPSARDARIRSNPRGGAGTPPPPLASTAGRDGSPAAGPSLSVINCPVLVVPTTRYQGPEHRSRPAIGPARDYPCRHEH